MAQEKRGLEVMTVHDNHRPGRRVCPKCGSRIFYAGLFIKKFKCYKCPWKGFIPGVAQ